jgi:hypothetical protein
MPKSPVSSSSADEVPHIFTRKSRLQREEFLITRGGQLGAIQAAASSLGVELSPVGMRDAGEIERGIRTFTRSANGGLIVAASTLFRRHDLAHKATGPHRLLSRQSMTIHFDRNVGLGQSRSSGHVCSMSGLAPESGLKSDIATSE